MKILVVAPRFHTNLYYRIQALKEHGKHEVSLAVLYRGKSELYTEIEPKVIGYSKIFQQIGKGLAKFRRQSIKSNLELKLSIPNVNAYKQVLKDTAPDVILLKDFLSLGSLVFVWYAFLRKIPIVMFVQKSKPALLGSKFLLRSVLKFLPHLGVRHMVTPVLQTKTFLEQCGVRNISYIPFVIDIPRYRPRTDAHFIRVMSVGKFVERKDQMLLIRALSVLPEETKFHLTLVGQKADPVYFENLQQLIKKEKRESTISILTDVPVEQMPEIYQDHDLFVMPSYDEPAAYSIVEAFAYGLPVICSDDCGTSCYIIEGQNGSVFHARSAASLGASLSLVMKSPQEIRELGRRSHRLATENHNMALFAKEMSTILNNL